MRRFLSLAALLGGAGVLVSACSSSGSGAPTGPDLRTCALLSACSGDGLGSSSFGQSCELVSLYEDPAAVSVGGSEAQLVANLVACYASATDCTTINACGKATPAQAAVCAGGTKSRCSGNVAVTCSGTPEAEDCASAGLVCGESSTGANCGAATCDPTTAKPQCNGDSLVTCNATGGVLESQDCKFLTGTSCSVGGGGTGVCTTHVADTCGVVNGVAQCVGTGAACDDSTFKNACNGTSIVSCTGGHTATFDCASLGLPFTCRIGKDGAASCVGAATECDAETFSETCSSGVVTFCYLGTKTTVDCKAYGLSGCKATPGTLGQPAVASCTP